MFSNYLKVAIRNLLKNKSYTLINIFGLAVGLTSCLLILLYVRFELSYDRHHENSDRIYRLVSERRVGATLEKLSNAPFLAAPVFANSFPEILQSTRLFRATNGASVSHLDRQFSEALFFFSDPNIFDVFTFEFTNGNSESALNAPNGMVITEAIAWKYFGEADPLGKVLSTSLLGRKGEFTVTGVVKNLAANSHLKFDFLVPFESDLNRWNMHGRQWNSGMLGCWTYFLFSNKNDSRNLESKFPAFVQTHLPESARNSTKFSLQPLTDIHLHSHLKGEFETNSNIVYIYIFSIIAILVLLIACVNFVNLSTAQSIRRAKEVGMRKTFGAQRIQLIKQFLGEAFFLSFLAIILSIVCAELVLPFFSALTGKPLELNLLNDEYVFPVLMGMWVLTGLLSGIYPALYLSRFKPIKALKGVLTTSTSGQVSLRSGIVVSQFTVSIILLIAFLTIFDQLNYIKNKELGFNKEQLLVISGRRGVNFETFKNELGKYPGILNVTVTSRVPGGRDLTASLFLPAGIDENARLQIPFLSVEKDFLETFDLDLLEGRDFSENDQGAIIINETAMKEFGWQTNAPGKEVVQFTSDSEQKWRVIGVIRDVHFESLYDKIKPLILTSGVNSGSRIIVRISPSNIAGTLAHVKKTWKSLSPDWPLDFYFLDEDLNGIYLHEEKLSKVVQYITFLAIFVSCMGLFGLVSFSAEQRNKEICIRKVVGASVSNIVFLLSKELITLIAVALVIAIPIAYFVINQWLQNFAYRVNIAGWTFLFAGGITLFIALLTISSQAIKAALANPVETLQCE